MDTKKLKHYAEALEMEIQANLGKSKYVDWLAQYQPLVNAIADAKAERITEPCDMGGLGYWVVDQSDIPKFDELSLQLSCFKLLLNDWPLPDDSPGFYGIGEERESIGTAVVETVPPLLSELQPRNQSVFHRLLHRLLGRKR